MKEKFFISLMVVLLTGRVLPSLFGLPNLAEAAPRRTTPLGANDQANQPLGLAAAAPVTAETPETALELAQAQIPQPPQVPQPPATGQPGPVPVPQAPVTPAPVSPERRLLPPPSVPSAGMVSLNFNRADLVEIIHIIAQHLRLTYTIDPEVKGTVTINSAEPLTVRRFIAYLSPDSADERRRGGESGKHLPHHADKGR